MRMGWNTSMGAVLDFRQNITPCILDMLLYAYTMLTSILRDAVSAGPNFLCILDMFITIFVMVRYDDEICPR